MAAGNEMRVSDAEREAAATELQEHFASGRLNQDELNERLAAAFAAKTRGDLNALFTDLPSSGHGWSAEPPYWGQGAFGPENPGPGWQHGEGPGSDEQVWNTGQRVATALTGLFVVVPVLAALGVVSLLSLGGGGKPLGIVLILAAFALLRRLLFLILGRRRGGGGRGRGGRGRGPRRRR